MTGSAVTGSLDRHRPSHRPADGSCGSRRPPSGPTPKRPIGPGGRGPPIGPPTGRAAPDAHRRAPPRSGRSARAGAGPPNPPTGRAAPDAHRRAPPRSGRSARAGPALPSAPPGPTSTRARTMSATAASLLPPREDQHMAGRTPDVPGGRRGAPVPAHPALDASPMAILGVDAAGVIVYANPQTVGTFGWTPGGRGRPPDRDADPRTLLRHPRVPSPGLLRPPERAPDGHRPGAGGPAPRRVRVPGRDQPCPGRHPRGTARLRDRRRHHRAKGSRRPAAAGPEDGIRRPPGRRHRPRLQQHAVRDPRPRLDPDR